jgi:hypothetical protein
LWGLRPSNLPKGEAFCASVLASSVLPDFTTISVLSILFISSIFLFSFEKIRERVFKRWRNISGSWAWAVSLMSLFGNSSLVKVALGRCCFSSCAYFNVAAIPALSLSKAKIISSKVCNSSMAALISSFNPLVP